MSDFGPLCERCGSCCTRRTMQPAGLAHLCGPDERGTCIHYDRTVGCRIYETRPENCRVDRVYYSQGFDRMMSKSVYYGVSRALCQQLQREHGWDASAPPRPAPGLSSLDPAATCLTRSR